MEVSQLLTDPFRLNVILELQKCLVDLCSHSAALQARFRNSLFAEIQNKFFQSCDKFSKFLSG